jgi:transcriptional regulator with XRE-family HTH domain
VIATPILPAITDIGGRIRALRRARRWAQVDLAARCGVLRFAVTRWELGIYQPDVAHLCRLADVFEISLDQLVRGKQP